MPVQFTTSYDTTPFILSGAPVTKMDMTIEQDAERTTPLKVRTLLTRSGNKYKPMTVNTEVPRAFLMGEEDIPAVDLVAGDVNDQIIMVWGDAVVLDTRQIVIENGLTLDTVLSTGDTLEEAIQKIGIMSKDTIDISR